MRSKRRFRPVEWGKSLLILLLALGLVYQLVSIRTPDSFRTLFSGYSPGLSGTAQVQSAIAVHPARLVVSQNGQRYGVQYDSTGTDAAFSALSIILSEALGSAGIPNAVTEQTWRSALTGTGIYVDFLYPIPLSALTVWLGGDRDSTVLTDPVRRLCLAAAENDGVSLYYINEENGLYYTCSTTLSRSAHLDAALENYTPNSALFAFEVPGMEALAPYTLLTATPQPAVYTSANPLLADSTRLAELLSALTFPSQSTALDPAAGGQIVEGGDSLRLSRNGLVTFHAISGEHVHFPLPEDSVQSVLDYVQALVQSTAGAWCGDAQLCLAGVIQTDGALEITFQYSLSGVPVSLPDDQAAARFVVRDGVVTDFTLYLRSYSAAGETSLVLPELQAAAAMEAKGAQGMELTLLYEDSGGELVSVGWVAM